MTSAEEVLEVSLQNVKKSCSVLLWVPGNKKKKKNNK